jgi:hypothetical protein
MGLQRKTRNAVELQTLFHLEIMYYDRAGTHDTDVSRRWRGDDVYEQARNQAPQGRRNIHAKPGP